MQLKPKIQSARVLAVAQGLLSPAQLPPSCRNLKTPAQVPRIAGGVQWSISWTDTVYRHKTTGLIRHRITLMGDPEKRSTAHETLGTPSLAAIRRALLEGIALPCEGQPGRPTILLLAHRLFPLFDKISEMCEGMGIHCVAETQAEAKASAANHDTDWQLHVLQGYNFVGKYGDEDDRCNLMLCTSDPDNGHRPDADTAGGAGSDTRQARDSADKQPAQAQKSSSSSRAAGSSAGRSSRSGAQRARPAGVKVKGK